MRENVLEVEVDTPKDGNLFFPPIGFPIRGRLDFMRLIKREANAVSLTIPFPDGVPGQRLRVDLGAQTCSIVEPLHEEKWAKCKAELENRGLPIPPASEDFPGAHVPDWLHEIKRSFDNGHVRIVRGEMPKDLGIETPRHQAKDPGEQRIDRLCDLVETLLERLVPAGASR
ncbi:MAG: hypothetical protein ACREJM_06275 [Candidatus Saccharimonadales bacterium]